MRVEVRLFATLRKYLPTKEIGEPSFVELDGQAKVSDLLARLGIPPGEAFVVMVNGRRQDLGWTLKDGDRIGIFPPVGGG